MALEVIEGDAVQRYSALRWRSVIAVVARRTFHRVNDSAGHAVFRRLVVIAARALGPGPTRLRLVKLAHTLDRHPYIAERAERAYPEEAKATRPTTRAA